MSTEGVEDLRICFLVSGTGGLFCKTIEASHNGLLASGIALCVADRKCEALGHAKRNGIETRLIQRSKFDSSVDFSDRIDAVLAEHHINLVILTFDSLVQGTLLTRFYGRLVNVHFSLLPAFKGFGALEKAVQTGVRYSGATIHLVDETVDGGPIIAQCILPLQVDENRDHYGEKLFHMCSHMLIQVIKWYEEKRIIFGPDQKPIVKQGQYLSYPYSPNLEIEFQTP